MLSAASVVRLDQDEVDETIIRIEASPGVVGVVIATREGSVIRSTVDSKMTQQYCSLLIPLAEKATNVACKFDAQNELKMFRMSTQKHEFMVVPDGKYILIVVQDLAEALEKIPKGHN